jgi:hypothetical protein
MARKIVLNARQQEVKRLIRKGRKVRYLLSEEAVQLYGHLAVRCGDCDYLVNHRKDVGVGWCAAKRFQTTTGVPVICQLHHSHFDAEVI